jgi:serine/threonine protein kinase
VADEELTTLRAALAGRYVLRDELGRGGTSVVFLADDVVHDRTVALKVLRADLVSGLTLKRFVRETEVAAALDHPNILPLLDVDQALDSPMVRDVPFLRRIVRSIRSMSPGRTSASARWQ